ncbi:hypothetical protein ATANTOWER_020751 [Ataeniobius toweri]|uniref:Uncharacterized protein n=1 Tax=Ataeniobius toweri TaxID=208326 RepID=A0ABU7BRN8_9TELE|nr:hypothetical protein [Ataeniobius toweri]
MSQSGMGGVFQSTHLSWIQLAFKLLEVIHSSPDYSVTLDTWWSLELAFCWSLRTCVCGLLLLETLTWKPIILCPATLSLSLGAGTQTDTKNLKHLPPGFSLPPPLS